ncbi:hypothetical protein AWV79_37300 [Cupriavidus sp. UYMMa02A]|nr:hypothetical protein AWV80_04510 [Cupriavidus sp. UYMU48A]ODV41407.1 hypothetical protein AWV79_37300 [Cupriavidus sp. UYMMa02A]
MDKSVSSSNTLALLIRSISNHSPGGMAIMLTKWRWKVRALIAACFAILTIGQSSPNVARTVSNRGANDAPLRFETGSAIYWA